MNGLRNTEYGGNATALLKHLRLYASLFLALFLLLTLSIPAQAEQQRTIYLFNHEANINNFASLKLEFDTYLSRLGGHQLQPFDDKDIFEKSVAIKKDGILLLSSWHYKKLKEKLSLKAALVGVLNGKSMQRRVLTAKKDVNNQEFNGMRVASAGSREYTRNILEEIFGNRGKGFVIMTVPKDIDALMSIGFGMATAALTSENSLFNFERINPKQHHQLRQLGQSDEMFLMIAATPENTETENSLLLKTLVKMGETTEGMSKLRMLGLQGFRELSNAEREALLK